MNTLISKWVSYLKKNQYKYKPFSKERTMSNGGLLKLVDNDIKISFHSVGYRTHLKRLKRLL